MIPDRVRQRAIEILRERRQQLSTHIEDTQKAPIEERNAAYDALIESKNFEIELPLFEAKYPGEFDKIAARRRRMAMEASNG